METPDYATYAQVIATLFIAIAIESGSRIPGASAADAESVQKRVHKEIARREWASVALWIALVAFTADLILLTTSLPRDMITFIQVGLAWFNVVAIGGMALLTIFGWYWQLNVIKENRAAEQEARQAAEGHGGE